MLPINVSLSEWVVAVEFCPQLPPCCGGSVIFVGYRVIKILLYGLLVGPTRSTYHVFLYIVRYNVYVPI